MTDKFETRFEIFPNPEILSHRVADWLVDLAVAKAGIFTVCLSGGSTPRLLYQRLTEPGLRERFPWSRTHWFWGDERFVPQDDPLSNYRMTHEALLSEAPIPLDNVHPIPTTQVSPQAAASDYERELMMFYGAERLDPARPLFDVTFLGLGTDGHTASLFPGSPILDERDRWVAPVIGLKPETRITLTYPTLESSQHVAFLVTGKDKQEVLDQLRQGNTQLPAGRLSPVGERVFFADAAAVGEIIA